MGVGIVLDSSAKEVVEAGVGWEGRRGPKKSCLCRHRGKTLDVMVLCVKRWLRGRTKERAATLESGISEGCEAHLA